MTDNVESKRAREMGVSVDDLRELEERLRLMPMERFLVMCFGPDPEVVYDADADLWIAPDPEHTGTGFGFMAIRRDKSFFKGVIPPEVCQ